MRFGNFSKNFSYVGIGKAGSTAFHGIFYLVFAALLDPESYGNLSYLIALAGTVSIISRFGLNQTVTVYQAKNNSTLSNQINVLAVITTTIASLILLTGVPRRFHRGRATSRVARCIAAPDVRGVRRCPVR